jgi:Zn-dependent M28 family amino/carboxypeptidase
MSFQREVLGVKLIDEPLGFDPDAVLRCISGISSFHRIQGSKGLVEAAEYVLEELSYLGLEARLLRDEYDGKRWHLTLPSPVAWELIEGSLEIPGRTLTTAESPLLVMAHSPPGEFEGELIPILREEDWERAEGKVVLVGKDWRNAYRRANEAGASGFIAYREGTGEFYPYIGLFLTRGDLEWARIPAFSVPETVAKDLIRRALSGGVKVKGTAQAEIKSSETLPMVYAEVGEPPYLLFTAHICHPKPGANDNASGSAMLLELARVLSTRENGRFGYAFLWIPEYHGSQAFIEKMGAEKYYASINLDMVAGSPDRSGSTLMFVRTPLSRFSVISGALEVAIELSNSKGKSFSGSTLPAMPFRTYPYEMGSDHDIFNFFGVPSVMPITWPDKFYHSSGDTIDKISRETIGIIGRAVLSAVLFLSEGERSQIERLSKGYSRKVLGEIGMRIEPGESGELVRRGLARDAGFLELAFDGGVGTEKNPWLEWRERGLVSERLIRDRAPDLAGEFKKLTEERAITTHLHELIMLSEILPEERAYRALEEEYKSIEKEKLKRLVEILEEAGVIVLSS